MATRGGIYWKIRDKSLLVSDRIKLVRYAWKHDSVVIPNKEQALLDWLCLNLAGKQRVTGRDRHTTWKCLCDILHTTKCHSLSAHGQALVLKNAVYQVLLDELASPTVSDDIIISCCHAVVMSPNVGYSFTSKYEYMLQLASTMLHKAKTQLQKGVEPGKDFQELLLSSLVKLRVVQSAKANPQQGALQMASRLFVSGVCVLHLTERYRTSDACTKTAWLDVESAFNALVSQAFFSKELYGNYDLYLRLKTEEVKSASVPPKAVEAIFTQVAMATSGQDVQCRQAVLDYIPHLFAHFGKSFHGPRDCTLHFKLLMHLGNILCEMPVAAANSVDQMPLDETLRCVRRLLESAAVSDIHNVSTDGATGGKEAKWLKVLAKWLLGLQNRCSSWFQSLQWILKINHLCLEDSLATVLGCTWLTPPQVATEAEHSCDQLLCDVVLTYDKLRQIPKLYAKMLQGINEAAAGKPCSSWPKEFEEKLGAAVTGLPQTAVVSLWKTLLSSLENTKSSSDKMAAICDLVSHFLCNVKVADYSITHQVGLQVAQLMQDTATIIEHLLKALVKQPLSDQPCCACSVLRVFCSWSELNLLLRSYTEYSFLKGSLGAVTSALSTSDLTYLLPTLDNTEWDKLFKTLEKWADKKMLYILGQLVVQKARALVLLTDTANQHSITSLQNCVSYLCTLTPDVMLMCDAPWDGRVSTVVSSNYKVALWSLLCNNLQYISTYAETEAMQRISHVMVRLMISACASDAGKDATLKGVPEVTTLQEVTGLMTLRGVTAKVISGDVVAESDLMQQHLVSAVWQTVGTTVAGPENSPKKAKRRRSTGLLPSQVFNTLGAHTAADVLLKDGSVEEIFSMEQKPVALSLRKQEELTLLLKLLELLPVEHFLAENQSRCILGLLTLLAQVDPAQISLEQSRLVQTAFRLLSLVLSSSRSGYSATVDSVGIPTVLCWLRRFEKSSQKALSKEMYGRVQTLLLKQCLRQHDSLTALDSYISQVVESQDSLSADEVLKEWQLRTIACLLTCIKVLGKVLMRSHLKEELGKVCKQHHQRLSGAFVAKLPTVIATGRTSQALEGYANLLHVAHSTGDEEALGKLAENFGSMCEMCLRLVLERETGSEEPEATLLTCLDFTRVASVARENLDSEKCNYFFQKVWERFVAVLQSGRQCGHSGIDSVEWSESCMTEPGNQVAVLKNQSEVRTAFSAELQEAVERTLGVVVSILDPKALHVVLQRLLESVDVTKLDGCHNGVVVALEIWQKVLEFHLAEDGGKVLGYACQTMLLKLQQVLLELSHREQSFPDVFTTALATVACMLAQGPVLVTPQCASLSLEACHHALEFLQRDVSVATFADVFVQIHRVLNEVLVGYPDAVFRFVPAFMSAANGLLRAIIIKGQQRSVVTMETDVERLVQCAQLVDRLFSLIGTHKVEFSKVAAYTVANYVNEVQKVTLLPQVKRALLPAIHRILELCDQHATAQLHVILSSASREIFKTLHVAYQKYYRYTGKV